MIKNVAATYIKSDWQNIAGDMPPPARGCLPKGRRGSPEYSASRIFSIVETILL